MILQVLIIISIALQLVAAVVAIRLTRVTKYNISWLLFTLGLVLMCMIRLSEYIYVVGGREWHLKMMLHRKKRKKGFSPNC